MRRSFLFCPANDAKRLTRVHERGADAVIIDLEDAVSDTDKVGARAGVADTIAGLAAGGIAVFVRINLPWSLAFPDLQAVVGPGLSGVVAPKVADSGQARVVGEMIRELEVARNLPLRSVELIALLESAGGLADAYNIASVPDVCGLALGSEDLSVELGVSPTNDSLDLPCKHVALAAASRGLMALGAPVSIGEFRDLDAYTEATRVARRIGMTGVFCVHPAQVDIANREFAPSEAELAEANGVLAAWEAAQRDGRSVVAHNGRMIDAPVVARARRLIGLR